MGTFLAISSVVGKTHKQVVNSLTNYAASVNGGLQQADNLDAETHNACVVQELNGNTSVLYPYGYLEWDKSSKYISSELSTAVFSFHIHDGDLWMYVLYKDGKIIDQFNPVPDYWEEDISAEEIDSWKGNVQTVAGLFPFIKTSDIDKYLVRWTTDEEEPSKAYPTDEFAKEDWQLLDFMQKLSLPYPINSSGEPAGQTYKLWTEQLPITIQKTDIDTTMAKKDKKEWWKFW